jgi:hypothetical protein
MSSFHPQPAAAHPPVDDDYRHLYQQLTASSLRQCPMCHQGRMTVVELLEPAAPAFTDTS